MASKNRRNQLREPNIKQTTRSQGAKASP